MFDIEMKHEKTTWILASLSTFNTVGMRKQPTPRKPLSNKADKFLELGGIMSPSTP
jgi:hypothetical protein